MAETAGVAFATVIDKVSFVSKASVNLNWYIYSTFV